MIDLSSEEEEEEIDIISTNDNTIGSVVLDRRQTRNGFLIISQANVSSEVDTSNILSPIVELTLLDAQGNEISTLYNSVTLCLDVGVQESSEDLCLSYLDENENPPEWKCQDSCLEYNGNGNQICGETGHFTSFAILLGAGVGCGGGDDEEVQKVIGWLSLAAIIIAVLCICCGIIMMELYMLVARKKQDKKRAHRARRRKSKLINSLKKDQTSSTTL